MEMFCPVRYDPKRSPFCEEFSVAALVMDKMCVIILRCRALAWGSFVTILNSSFMNKLLDRPNPKQAGYSWRLFIPMKTQLTDTSPLTLAMLS